jgi:cell division protein FtsB
MADDQKSIGEIYAERAMQGSQETPPRPAKLPASVQPTPDFRSSGPAIYGGNPSSSQDEFTERVLAGRNKAATPRKRSTFNMMLTMILIAMGIVLYVGNVIAVQQLLKEVGDRQARLQQILNEQEVLKAQINLMSGLERIRSEAENNLGLHNPNGAPEWIIVDSSKISELDDDLSSRPSARQKPEQ